jgi:hypothetical protein
MSLLASRAPVLPIGALPRVDLLPPSEMRRRDMLARARAWGWIGLGALAVALTTVGGAYTFQFASTVRLGAEQARTQDILVEIAALSEVSSALTTRNELRSLRAEAMAGDLAWGPVLERVAANLPPGVVVTEYALEAGPVPAAESDPETVVGVQGTVTFTSPAAIDFVAATRELRGGDGMLDADLDAFTSADGVYTYTVRIALDQNVYTGGYAPVDAAADADAEE